MNIKSDKVEIVSTNLLIPYSKNSNKHTDEQIDEIIKQIEYQGWRDPILAQKGTNVIAAGHGRWMAAKKMGLEKVPVIFQEFESEAQFYAFVVAHNAVTSPGWGGGLDLAQINSDIIDFGPELDVSLLAIKDFVIDINDSTLPSLEDSERPEIGQLAFSVSETQRQLINDALSNAIKNEELDLYENTNKNAAAIYLICQRYMSDRS